MQEAVFGQIKDFLKPGMKCWRETFFQALDCRFWPGFNLQSSSKIAIDSLPDALEMHARLKDFDLYHVRFIQFDARCP